MPFLLFLLATTFAFSQNNLLAKPNLWTATTDPYGSSLDTAKTMIHGDSLQISFTVAPKTDKGWPYIEVISKLEKHIQSGKKLQLTYKCDKPLLVKLSQNDFKQSGTNSFAHYEFIVPMAQTWSQVTIDPKNFKQPSWASAQDKKIALNLKNVDDVYFTPKTDVFKGDKANLQIKHFAVLD